MHACMGWYNELEYEEIPVNYFVKRPSFFSGPLKNILTEVKKRKTCQKITGHMVFSKITSRLTDLKK